MLILHFTSALVLRHNYDFSVPSRQGSPGLWRHKTRCLSLASAKGLNPVFLKNGRTAPPRRACTTLPTSTMPAASASSSTSRDAARTPLSSRGCGSSSTCCTAARAAARRRPATAPASSSRCRTRFLRKVTAPLGIALPPAGNYGAGFVFLPHGDAARAQTQARVRGDRPRGRAAAARLARRADRRPPARRVGGRGRAAVRAGLHRRRDAVRSGGCRKRCARFERKLYVIRKRVEHAVDASTDPGGARLLHPEPVGEHARSTRAC